jgi:hypothetical protein
MYFHNLKKIIIQLKYKVPLSIANLCCLNFFLVAILIAFPDIDKFIQNKIFSKVRGKIYRSFQQRQPAAIRNQNPSLIF